MEDIKFRGKDINSNEWVYGYLYREGGRSYILDEGRSCEVLANTVSQYTGLNDKNGVEIYGGDTVTGHYSNMDVDYSTSSVVEWGILLDSDGYRAGATMGWVTSNGSSLYDLVNSGGCEVVGK